MCSCVCSVLRKAGSVHAKCERKRKEILQQTESPKYGVGAWQLRGNAAETSAGIQQAPGTEKCAAGSVAGRADLCGKSAMLVADPYCPRWWFLSLASFPVVMSHPKNIVGVEGPAWSLKQIGLKLGFTKAWYLKWKKKCVQKIVCSIKTSICRGKKPPQKQDFRKK